MKINVDRQRTERDFAVGEWVYLRLHPYKQKSLRQSKMGKFSPRYYGPFQILKKVVGCLTSWIYPHILGCIPPFMFPILRQN